MAGVHKFLDQKGVEHLWSKINMQDYPNNEILMSVISAIDETKADKENVAFISEDVAAEIASRKLGDENLQSQIDTKATRKVAVVGSDTGNSAGWYKVASGTMTKWTSLSLLFAVHTPATSGKHSGILQLDLRGGTEAIEIGDTLKLGWLVRAGFDLSQVIVVVDGYDWALYYKVQSNQFFRAFFEVIQESNDVSINKAVYTLHTDSVVETTAPVATATSTDLGTVNTANKLTTSCKINGVEFDGSKDVDITANNIASVSSNTNLAMDIGALSSDISRINAHLGDQTSSKTIHQLIDNLAAYIGYTDDDIYGVEVDFKNNTFTRLAGAKNKSAGADFDNIPIFGGRKRGYYDNNGNYFNPISYPGDVSRYQSMVFQPKFYYKVVPIDIEDINTTENGNPNDWGFSNLNAIRKARYYVTATPHEGFKLHPAFYDENGNELEYILIGSYEACRYVNANSSNDLENGSDALDLTNDRLSSVTNALPLTGEHISLNRANAEKLANNIGAGWHIENIKTISARQLLMLIEYATFNMQTAIGRGVVDCSDSTSSNTGETTIIDWSGMTNESSFYTSGTILSQDDNGIKISDECSVTGFNSSNPTLSKLRRMVNIWNVNITGGTGIKFTLTPNGTSSTCNYFVVEVNESGGTTNLAAIKLSNETKTVTLNFATDFTNVVEEFTSGDINFHISYGQFDYTISDISLVTGETVNVLPIVRTGGTDSLLNSSGMAEGTNGLAPISYRGVENPWGNTQKIINGITFWSNTELRGGRPYICNDFNYAEGKKDDNYEAVNILLPQTNGYISAFGYDANFDWLFIPIESNGNSSSPVGDSIVMLSDATLDGKYYGYAHGGNYRSSTSAGAHNLGVFNGYGDSRSVRLLYIPTANM